MTNDEQTRGFDRTAVERREGVGALDTGGYHPLAEAVLRLQRELDVAQEQRDALVTALGAPDGSTWEQIIQYAWQQRRIARGVRVSQQLAAQAAVLPIGEVPPDIVTPSTAHMSAEERQAGVAQMLADLRRLAEQDGCVAAAWALEVIEPRRTAGPPSGDTAAALLTIIDDALDRAFLAHAWGADHIRSVMQYREDARRNIRDALTGQGEAG